MRFILTLLGIHLYSYSAWCLVYCLHIYIKVRGSIQTRCLKLGGQTHADKNSSEMLPVVGHISGGWLTGSSLQKLSQSFSFLKESFSCLDKAMTFMCFFFSHCFVALVVCFRSLSCWKTHQLIFSVLAEGRKLSSKFNPCSSILQPSCPVSLTENLTMSSPPCLTVVVVWAVFLPTQHVQLVPDSSMLVSSALSSKPSQSCSVLPVGFMVTVVPTAFRLLTTTFLMVIFTLWGKTLHGAPDPGWLMVIYILSICK